MFATLPVTFSNLRPILGASARSVGLGVLSRDPFDPEFFNRKYLAK